MSWSGHLGARSKDRSRSSSTWVGAVAWLVLVVGVIAAGVGATSWKNDLDQSASESLHDSAKAATAVVSSNLALDANLMAQLRGLVVAFPQMTNAQFLDWWNASEISEGFPGGTGFAYVERVPAAQLPSFAAARTLDPINGLPPSPTFTVLPDTHPAEYCLQKVGYWKMPKVKTFQVPAGLDFCAAVFPGNIPSPLPELLAAATDSGLPAVLSPKQMIPGVFAVLLPIYRGGVIPGSVAARRAASLGWFAGSFESAALTGGAIRKGAGLEIEVSHAGPAGASLISAAGNQSVGASGRVVSTVSVHPAWSIRVVGAPPAGSPSAEREALAIFGAGVVLSVLAFLFLRLLVGSRERALDLVEERTGELAYQTLHDSLTGLPNRALILDRAGGMLARARRDHHAVAAFFIDIDDFKIVNDTLGHGAGDELLQAVATRFEDVMRASDTVGRLGGDEFVVLVEGTSLEAGPEAVAQRVLDSLHKPFMLKGEPRVVAVSIGIASGPRSTPDDWLRDADVALYEAKAAGKNGYVVFESGTQPRPADPAPI